MSLLRCAAAGRRTRARLAVLGVLSMAGLLAGAGVPSLTPAGLRLARHALAQSDTATPSVLPQPDASPTPPNPTAGLGEPPLTLQSSASVSSAGAGEQFNFTATVVGSSVEPRAVELRTNIDGQLELLSASASGGSCSGGSTLVCKLNVRRGQPATVVAAVRVRPNAAPGGRLVYQALAQDDLSNTAASDQVVVTIAAPPVPPAPSPTSTPDRIIPAPRPEPVEGDGAAAPARPTIQASQPMSSAPTAAPAGAANVPRNPASIPVVAPIALPSPVASVAVTIPPAGGAAPAAPAEGAAGADSWLVTSPAASMPAQEVDSVASSLSAPDAYEPPPALAPPADPPAPEPSPVALRQIVQLPNTAAMPPAIGFVAGLLGLALLIHGLRRVRRAAAQLDRQSAALARLAALLDAQVRRRARVGGAWSLEEGAETRPDGHD